MQGRSNCHSRYIHLKVLLESRLRSTACRRRDWQQSSRVNNEGEQYGLAAKQLHLDLAREGWNLIDVES
jgi:hypothetical protein